MNVEQQNVSSFLKVFKKRWPLIVAVTLIFTLVSGLVSFFVLPPTYEASSKVLVNEINPQQNANDAATSFYQMETSFKLFDTFIVVAESPQVLGKVIDNLSLNDSYQQLSERVSISQVRESLAIEIKAQADTPQQAVNIVNEVATVLNYEISKLYGENQVSILKQGDASDTMPPVKPKPYLNMVVAFLAGLVVSVGAAFVLELMGKSAAFAQNDPAMLKNDTLPKVNKL